MPSKRRSVSRIDRIHSGSMARSVNAICPNNPKHAPAQAPQSGTPDLTFWAALVRLGVLGAFEEGASFDELMDAVESGLMSERPNVARRH